MLLRKVLAVSGLVVSSVHAAVSKQCPSSDLCFSLNIPKTTISAQSEGELYLQITGPTSFSWISLAQGKKMAGAHYFIIYTSADEKNVTVSTRLADGWQVPEHTSDTKYEVLEGTGVENGIMTANIKCSNCHSWSGGSMNLSSDSTSWIWAHVKGDALRTDDPNTRLLIHDLYGPLIFDTSSHGGPSSNPFLTNSPPNSTSPPTTPAISAGPPARIVRMWTAHAILACVAWAFVFPLGGILMRVCSFRDLLWVHALLQLLGFGMYAAAVGLGVSLSVNPHWWMLNDEHVIIGLVLCGLLFVQSVAGYMHHVMFKKHGSRSLYSYVHVWVGRGGITLGMVDAGFGFRLTRKGLAEWEVFVYAVCAVVMWVAYVMSVLVGPRLKRMREGRGVRLTGDMRGPRVPRSERREMSEKDSSDDSAKVVREG